VNQPIAATARGSVGVPAVTEDLNWTLRLLACGVVAAPLFVGVVLIEAATRHGFDLVRMPISLLSVGDAGWVQQANFMFVGLLFGVSSFGLVHHRLPGGAVWGARLIGVFAVGLVACGPVFSGSCAWFSARSCNAFCTRGSKLAFTVARCCV